MNAELSAWPVSGERRRAGVSAFGVGGTNVHLALESPPPAVRPAAVRRAALLLVSARSEAALAEARERLAARLSTMVDADLPDVEYTLAAGRRAFAYRDAIVAETMAEAVERLREPLRSDVSAVTTEPVVAFLFPGQGAQYAGMGAELYARLPVFRNAIDRCAEIVRPLMDVDLRELLYPAEATEAAQARLLATESAQVALFSVEYAISCVWADMGIAPAVMLGHSVGEFVAGVLSGVFELAEALAIVRERGRLMGALPGGSMLAVRLSEERLRPLISPPIDIAAINAPGLCVLSGPTPAIEVIEARLTADGVISRRLHTSHAFHSAMMDPVVEPLMEAAARAALRTPQIPYVSGVTGDWITADEATSGTYWARHCREPVRFARGLETLLASDVDALVEIGPGTTLSTFARQGAARGTKCEIGHSLPTSERETSDLACFLQTAANLWIAGAPVDVRGLHREEPRRRIPLPTYPFERTRYWLEPASAGSAQPRPSLPTQPLPTVKDTVKPNDRPNVEPVIRELTLLFADVSGENLADADPATTFLELGFDSLFLGRIVGHIQSRFHVSVTFRQLLDSIPSLAALANYIVTERPAAAVAEPQPVGIIEASPNSTPGMEGLIRDQIAAMQQLFRDQLAAIGGTAPAQAVAPPGAPAAPSTVSKPTTESSRFDAFKMPPAHGRADVTPIQQAHIEEVIARTVARTSESKRRAQHYRRVLADPRVAAGFRAEWKEMVYPITCARAKGSRLWDIDGNEYIDLLNGFGQTAFGHSPDFVIAAVQQQLSEGFAIGPQTDLAGRVAEAFCEMTGSERVTFCNTGSEAVMAAMRVARTVTGRSKIVVFDGSYHGQFDEVLVKSARSSHRSLPVAAGIPNESVSNITVLEYGAPEALAWIREHARELAAVIVEPVQSRHPALRPLEFLRELRAVTNASGTALVFDEVVTGFRVHPGGMQAVFGIKADLATYGKVVGGGLPVGILAGSARFMDALDGGMWTYGDDSFPQVAPTFFAGTFVRHPLAMAAVLAVLEHLKAGGAELQRALSDRTARLVGRMNDALESREVATRIESFGSMFYLNFSSETRLASLLFYHLRNRGVYLQESFPCFLTTEHTDADVDLIVAAFESSLDELRAAHIMGSAPATAVSPREIPLTESQTEIWLVAQLGDDASCAFNESITLRLHGELDRIALERAWAQVIARHQSLRATFSVTGERMRIAGDLEIPLSYEDAVAAPDARLAAFLERDAKIPFDLIAGPLVRGSLFRLGSNDHALIVTAHHLVCDGWSINVILEEIAEFYAARAEQRTPSLAQPVSFSDYSIAQTRRDPADRERVESYWLEAFASPVAPLQLPADRPRPARRSFAGATRSAHIDIDLYRRIRELGARNGCTLFVTLLTAFQVLIGRLAESNDVVVGVPTAGQASVDGGSLVGHCVNFLPIRATWQTAASIASLLTQMKRSVLEAYEHQDYTLGTLVRKLALSRDVDRVPLAEVQFNLERVADGLAFPGLRYGVEPNAKAFVNFDLFLNVIETDAGLRLDCDYNTDLFDPGTIDRWLASYRQVLESAASNDKQSATHITFIPDDERRALLVDFNATDRPFAADSSLQAAFEARAALHPDRIAVRLGDRKISYGELDARANQLAGFLLSRIGDSGRLVGVCVDRSIEMVVALLGTLKAGCAYVPLDPTHPPARLRKILAEANVAALIIDGTSSANLVPNGVHAIHLSADANAIGRCSTAPVVVQRSSEDLAYVIYTSGSTGAPKGVEITHRSVVNFLTSMASEPGFTETDSLLAVTTIAFDIAGLELYLPLSTGGRLDIASMDDLSDGFALLRKLADVSVMQATPATWRLLLEAGLQRTNGLRMLCGGEALPRELADRLIACGGELWNMYGPTETTIWSSCARVVADDAAITAGTPIANTQMYVLDANDQPVPLGVPGQLHIGGDGVAAGYFKRAELSAECFIANPFGSGRLYRTGDRARAVTQGGIQILGRIDNQIKLRGYRIELGEIESVLEKSGALAAVTVLLREDQPGNAKLVAYYVLRPGVPQTASSLREIALRELPHYMVPSDWVAMAALPLSPSGKVDRSALAAMQTTEEPQSPAVAQTARHTPTEAALLRIFADVLHNNAVTTADNLLELGADSLQIFAITARANAEGITLAARDLFRFPTIDALAQRLAVNSSARLEARNPEKAGGKAG